MDTLHEDQYRFLIISHLMLLRMRNVSDKPYRENQNTYFMFNNFFTKIVPFMTSRGKNIVEQAGHRERYGACALHAGYLRLQIHIQNISYLMVFPR
jgi:hypothetical protein